MLDNFDFSLLFILFIIVIILFAVAKYDKIEHSVIILSVIVSIVVLFNNFNTAKQTFKNKINSVDSFNKLKRYQYGFNEYIPNYMDKNLNENMIGDNQDDDQRNDQRDKQDDKQDDNQEYDINYEMIDQAPDEMAEKMNLDGYDYTGQTNISNGIKLAPEEMAKVYSVQNDKFRNYENFGSTLKPFVGSDTSIDSKNEYWWRNKSNRQKQAMDAKITKGKNYYKHIFEGELNASENSNWIAEYDELNIYDNRL